MVKIIAVASHKGGVGKTTTALNLGFSLSRFGHKVLMIDVDPQAGLEVSTNLKKVTERGLVDLLKEQCSLSDIVKFTKGSNLAITGVGVRTTEDVLYFEECARNGALADILAILKQDFDYVILDCPPGIGGIIVELLKVSTEILIAINCKILALRTLPAFLKTVHYVQNLNENLRLAGVLVTMFQEGNTNEQKLLSDLRKMLPEEVFFKTMVPYNEMYERASIRSLPVSMLKGGQKVGRQYYELALEYKERELEQTTEGDDHDEDGLF